MLRKHWKIGRALFPSPKNGGNILPKQEEGRAKEMTSRKVAFVAFCLVAACGSPVPDSNPYAGRGVGFDGYDRYSAEQARRDAALETPRFSPVPEEQAIASETLGVLNATRTAATVRESRVPTQSDQPLSATSPAATTAAASTQVTAINNPEISDEQSFEAVANRETIESDKERLARQREAYQVVQPEAIPDRPGDTGPNIVAFALSTANGVGQQLYRRTGTVSDSKFQRACSRFPTSDQAQLAFLNAGGPKRDRQGLDPDGDGFACYWDPAPFRAARGG